MGFLSLALTFIGYTLVYGAIANHGRFCTAPWAGVLADAYEDSSPSGSGAPQPGQAPPGGTPPPAPGSKPKKGGGGGITIPWISPIPGLPLPVPGLPPIHIPNPLDLLP